MMEIEMKGIGMIMRRMVRRFITTMIQVVMKDIERKVK